MVETKEINAVMRSRELAIGIKKKRVACDGLIKELHGLEQILSCSRAKRNAINKIFGSQVRIIGDKVCGRWLFDRDFSVDETCAQGALRPFA